MDSMELTMTPRDIALAYMQVLLKYTGWQAYNVEPLTEALIELPNPSRDCDMVEWASQRHLPT